MRKKEGPNNKYSAGSNITQCSNRWRTTPEYKFKKPTTELEKYAQDKLRLLVMDFLIKPTEEEMKRLYSGQNEIQIDNYSRWIFDRTVAT